MNSHHTNINLKCFLLYFFFFFFNDTATTEIYTLSLHDALPISVHGRQVRGGGAADSLLDAHAALHGVRRRRSEEHTSELQSRLHLVCRLLLEKKKNVQDPITFSGIVGRPTVAL